MKNARPKALQNMKFKHFNCRLPWQRHKLESCQHHNMEHMKNAVNTENFAGDLTEEMQGKPNAMISDAS